MDPHLQQIRGRVQVILERLGLPSRGWAIVDIDVNPDIGVADSASTGILRSLPPAVLVSLTDGGDEGWHVIGVHYSPWVAESEGVAELASQIQDHARQPSTPAGAAAIANITEKELDAALDVRAMTGR